MNEMRSAFCDDCGIECRSHVIDLDKFNASLVEEGWVIPESNFNGVYICADCLAEDQNLI